MYGTSGKDCVSRGNRRSGGESSDLGGKDQVTMDESFSGPGVGVHMRYVLAVVVLVVSLVRPGTPHAVAAAAAPTGLDLAAMAINTIDLDDLDMPGYGYRLSSWMTPEELFGESDDMDIYVDDFGLGWSYSGVLNLTDPDDPELLATLQVVLTLSAFDTATGAADAFDSGPRLKTPTPRS